MGKTAITVKFSKNFYHQEAVRKGISAYKNLAEFNFEETGNFWEITIKNPDKDFKNIIADEFCNYVLSKN